MNGGGRSPDESCMSRNTPKDSLILPTLTWSTSSQKEEGPIGQPRRQKPPRTTGTSGGREEEEASQSLGMKRRDFSLLRWRPTEGPSDSTMWRAAERSPGGPTRVPSSRYQAFKAREGTSALIRSMIGWRVRANPSGPRGSPCCTPQQL